MVATGWMIAIASVGIYTAAACGALWGFLVFPRLVPVSGCVLPTAARIAIPIFLMAGPAYCLVRPLLPNPALTNAKIEVIRRVGTGVPTPQLDLSYLGPTLAEKAKSLEGYVSLTRMEFKNDDRNQVRVLLIVDDAQPTAYVPAATGRQRHLPAESWYLERRTAETSIENRVAQ